MKKRILAFLMAMVMVFSLAACGDEEKKTNTGANNAASKQGVFKVSEVNMATEENVEDMNINQIKIIDDTIYLIAYTYYNNGYAMHFMTMDKEGSVLTKYPLMERYWDNVDTGIAVPLEEAAADVAALVTTDKIAATTTEVTENTEESEIEEYKDVYTYQILEDGRLAYVETYETYNNKTYESSSTCYLVICDKDGQEFCRTNLTEHVPDDSYFWANTIIPSEADSLFVMNYEMIFEVDMDGNILGVIETTDVTRDIYSPSFYKDGLPVVGVWNEDWTKQTYGTIDIRKGEMVEELALPENFSNYNVSDGVNSGYDLILTSNNGVYGYNFGDTEYTLIMDYINSDLATYRVNNVTFIDSDHFIAMYNDVVDYNSHVANFTKVPPEEVPDREVLVMASYGKDTEVTKKIIEFNQSSDKYRITVNDYSQYSTNEDYYAGIDKLNNEIISGNIPDIISCSARLPIANYVSKGILADFYELMEEDETINREDYCENVFQAYEIDGKLYEMPTSFYIWTVYGKTSVFGDKTSLTWDELDAVLAEYPGSSAFNNLTKTDILSTALRFNYSKLVDSKTGECYFNSDMFKEILEFANTYPETIDWEKLYQDEDYWINYETQLFIENRTLLNQGTIYNFFEGWMNGYYRFAEATTPVGFPTDEGIGSTLAAISSYAISAKSANKDGAWEFVKSFITEEAQMKEERSDYWGLPILKAALEDSAQYITQKPYYIDAEGNKVEYENTVWINNQEVAIEPATEEEAQKWIDFVLSVEVKGSYDYDDALEIINEEAAAYFSGQKTVEAVMEIIQSRMNIFISESR